MAGGSMVQEVKRLPDWADRLSALVAIAHQGAFEWGVRDCCLWAADGVKAVTGFDPGADLRGTYCDARGAYRALHALGGLRGAGAMTGTPIEPLWAGAGDVGLVAFEGRPMLAVCAGRVWLAVATRGLHALTLSAARLAWGVGRA